MKNGNYRDYRDYILPAVSFQEVMKFATRLACKGPPPVQKLRFCSPRLWTDLKCQFRLAK